MALVAPSMLSADFLSLGKDVEMVNRCADIFHLDVMDGTLVPNLSYGFPVVEAIASKAEKPLDVHLMIVHPEKYIARFAKAGADMISFHLEAARLAQIPAGEILASIRAEGAKAGLAVNPDISIEDTFAYLGEADFILVMSVFAGFGGQKFIEDTYGRVSALKAEIERLGLGTQIEVDGGVSPANAGRLAACGADILVAGSSVFNAPDPSAAVQAMQNQII